MHSTSVDRGRIAAMKLSYVIKFVSDMDRAVGDTANYSNLGR